MLFSLMLKHFLCSFRDEQVRFILPVVVTFLVSTIDFSVGLIRNGVGNLKFSLN